MRKYLMEYLIYIEKRLENCKENELNDILE